MQRKLLAPLLEVMLQDKAICRCGKEFTHLLNENVELAQKAGMALRQHDGKCSIVSSPGRSHRHSLLKEVLDESIRKAQPDTTTQLEQRIAGTQTIVDITTTRAVDGNVKLIDVTFIGALRRSTIDTVGLDGDTSIKHGEGKKRKNLEDGGVPVNLRSMFVPFVVTDTGRLGPAAMAYIDSLTGWDQVPRIFDARLARIRKHLIRSIGVITERSNARLRVALRQSLTWAA